MRTNKYLSRLSSIRTKMEICKIQEKLLQENVWKENPFLFFIDHSIGRKKKKSILHCMREFKLKSSQNTRRISRDNWKKDKKQTETGNKMLRMFLQNHEWESLNLSLSWTLKGSKHVWDQYLYAFSSASVKILYPLLENIHLFTITYLKNKAEQRQTNKKKVHFWTMSWHFFHIN